MWMVAASFAQTASQNLQKAFQQFETDSQLKHAISSLYIIDAKTGQVVFDKNSQVGLAPASTQKIITSVTAFELLGKDYRYKTEFGILKEGNKTMLYIMPSGDPTFGSWRWEYTQEEKVLTNLKNAIAGENINGFTIYNSWKLQHSIPDGWIWQDIGNYYGAGASLVNWRENQYDIVLKSDKQINDRVDIVDIKPTLYYYTRISLLSSAKGGIVDNAYNYFPTKENFLTIKGTIPVNEDKFKISGSFPNPEAQFLSLLKATLKKNINDTSSWTVAYHDKEIDNLKPLYTFYSPSLDSIIYWFNKKSINLYGEALIKTFAYEKQGFGSTDSGVAIVKKFWKQKGLDEDELNMYDGSGLSPLNRVTTHAQVEILKYAKTKDWFQYFYNSLPDYNGMKMKSGTISDVKGFCGYHKAKDGKEYIFSFLVNNYRGKTSGVVQKMYKVLDELK